MDEPVLITANDHGHDFMYDHLSHFFDTRCFEALQSLTKEDRERFYKLMTENESLATKLYGHALLNSKIFFPVALRNGVDNPLMQEYKDWLAKQ
jgi:hypothetical protein